MKATLQQSPGLLWQIRPTNILSFGPDTEALPLESLNVLIGPNGAGKSNLIEVLTLLQACPTDLREAVRRGGGVADWIWKGASAKAASVEAVVDYRFDRSMSLRHVIEFQEDNHNFRLAGERIEDAAPDPGEPEQYFYRYQHGMGGTVQVHFIEDRASIPATRLSDGSLRYLCLLAILCDPEPPPLICIEEPELGLHPHILPKLADLLMAASERTQLIVTTHSDILVDAMTERPEAVVVCEKHDGQTTMKRLRKEDLGVWLGKYRLGQLWIDGQLGGKRW